MKRVSRSAIVEHSAAEMFSIVDDVGSYPKFIPWCLESTVHERTADRMVATIEIGYRGIRQGFTTSNLNVPAESIEMALVKGPFKRFAAGWRFKALTPGACRIEFHLEYEFSSAALGKLLAPLFEHMANTMVDVFTQRADALAAQR